MVTVSIFLYLHRMCHYFHIFPPESSWILKVYGQYPITSYPCSYSPVLCYIAIASNVNNTCTKNHVWQITYMCTSNRFPQSCLHKSIMLNNLPKMLMEFPICLPIMLFIIDIGTRRLHLGDSKVISNYLQYINIVLNISLSAYFNVSLY